MPQKSYFVYQLQKSLTEINYNGEIMDSTECNKFYQHLFRQYVEHKVAQFRYYYYSVPHDPKKYGWEERPPASHYEKVDPYEIKRQIDNALNPVPMIGVTKSLNALNYGKQSDVPHIQLRNALGSNLVYVRDHVLRSRFMAEHTGFLSLLDHNFEAVLDCLNVGDIPEDDYTVLSKLGYCDSRAELEGMVADVKANKNSIVAFAKENGGTYGALGYVSHLVEETEKLESRSKSERRLNWISKILSIIKGSTEVTANISAIMFTAGLGIPAVASVVLGVGEVIGTCHEIKKMTNPIKRN